MRTPLSFLPRVFLFGLTMIYKLQRKMPLGFKIKVTYKPVYSCNVNPYLLDQWCLFWHNDWRWPLDYKKVTDHCYDLGVKGKGQYVLKISNG